MKELLLKQLQTYSQNINSIENELIELEKVAIEKRTLLEQNKGAYNAVIAIAIEQKVLSEDGAIIEDNTETE